MIFFTVYALSIIPLLVPQDGPIAAKGLCKGEGIAIYSGVFGISRYRGYRTRLDRKSRDSGTLSI